MRTSFASGATLLLTIIGVALPGCGSTPSEPRSEELSVLFVGNSQTYRNDLTDMLQALLEAADVGPVRIVEVAYGGFGLEDHWVQGEARPTIALGGWDVVVMQQGPSATEGRPSLLDYSQRFSEEIRAVGAIPALYMVWPADVFFHMFDGVSDSYETAAELVDGYLFPVGEAWRAAWRRDPDLALYHPDGLHATMAGSYLAALVMFEQLAGMSPVGFDPLPGNPGLSTELVQLLQESAAEANQQFARVPEGH